MKKYSILVRLPLTHKSRRKMYNLPLENPLKDILFLTLNRCMQSVNAGSGSIFLLDEEKEELVLEIVKNRENLHLEGIRKRLGEGISGRVALERKPLLVEDIRGDSSFQFDAQSHHYQSRSFLSIPLESSGNLIGVLNISEKSGGIIFDTKDLDSVLNICKNLGVTIYNLKDFLKKQHGLNKELTEQLKDLKNLVEQSKKFSSVGKLVGGFVHEINNPLDGIIRYINLSLDCVAEEGVVREYLLEAKQGLNRIAQFVRSLLDYSWSLSSQERKIDINRILEESLFLYGSYFNSYNIEVNKDLSPDLPKIADQGLKIVFNNIIKNACEAMKKNGGELIVSTSIIDTYVEIEFSDTGEGIPRDIQEKIFEPFFTTKNIGEGSGLGLAISREVIQRYNGKLFLRDKKGKGTIFVIRLPYSEPH